jgi:hypothetical protein
MVSMAMWLWEFDGFIDKLYGGQALEEAELAKKY